MLPILLLGASAYQQYRLPSKQSWGSIHNEPKFLGPCWSYPKLKEIPIGKKIHDSVGTYPKPEIAAKFCEKNPKCQAISQWDNEWTLYEYVSGFQPGSGMLGFLKDVVSHSFDRKCWEDLKEFGLGNEKPTLDDINSMTTDDFIDQMKWGCCTPGALISAFGGKTRAQCEAECKKRDNCVAFSTSGEVNKYCTIHHTCSDVALDCGNNGLPWRTYKRWTPWGDCVENKSCGYTSAPISDPNEKLSDSFEWLLPFGEEVHWHQLSGGNQKCNKANSNFRNYTRYSLDECKDVCKVVEGCHAVTYNSKKSECRLMGPDVTAHAYEKDSVCWKKTESRGLKNARQACWGRCGHKSGPCSWCGTGLCCRRNFRGGEKGCSATMGGSGHVCTANPNAAKTVPADNKSLAKCKELCAAHSECTGITSFSETGGCLAWKRNACQETNTETSSDAKTCMYHRKGSASRHCSAGVQWKNTYGRGFGQHEHPQTHLFGDLMARLPNGYSLWMHCPAMQDGYTCNQYKLTAWRQPAHRFFTEKECLNECEEFGARNGQYRGGNLCCMVIKQGNGFQCFTGDPNPIKKVGYEEDGFPQGVMKATMCTQHIVPTNTCRKMVNKFDYRYPRKGRRLEVITDRKVRLSPNAFVLSHNVNKRRRKAADKRRLARESELLRRRKH